MEIVHQSDSRVEVRISGRSSVLLGLAGGLIGAAGIWLGMREAAVLPLAIGVFVSAMGLGTVWLARDIRHVLDAAAGTATVESRRLLVAGSRGRRVTVYELSHVADVELEQRRSTGRSRRRGRRHPTWRLAYRFRDGRVEPWADAFGSGRENFEACLTAARAVLIASRVPHPHTA